MSIMFQTSTRKYVFSGTSLDMQLCKTHFFKKNCELMPPIRRDSIYQIIENNTAGTIIILDGIFYQNESVSITEIRRAISLGWKVYGACSMGALRAVECAPLGMIGFGRVYQWLRLYKVQDDDEIVQAINPNNSRPTSDAMIDIRYFLNQLSKTRLINAALKMALIEHNKGLFFSQRSITSTIGILKNIMCDEDFLGVLKFQNQYVGIKTLDALNLLDKLSLLNSAGEDCHEHSGLL